MFIVAFHLFDIPIKSLFFFILGKEGGKVSESCSKNKKMSTCTRQANRQHFLSTLKQKDTDETDLF